MTPTGRFMAMCCFLTLTSPPALAQVNVVTYHDNNARTGANLSETVLRPDNVGSSTFGKRLAYSVDGHVYAQPLYVSDLTIPGRGEHNVLFIATEHNTVYAFDADIAADPHGGLLWQTNLGPSAATPNSDFGNRYGLYHDITPEVGITSTPVIDLSSGTIYIDAFTHEGPSYVHRLHALDIATGAEKAFSPVQVTASVPGVGIDSVDGVVTFNPMQQLQRSALTLAGDVVYLAFAGYADTDPYHGWVIGFNATNLLQLTNYVFNVTPNSTNGPNPGEGGIWMAGCGPSVDAGTNLFFETGNGRFDALNGSGGTEYGDSFVKLSTAGGLAVIDYFTPYNQATLETYDLDLGSGGLLLLPDQPGPYPHLLVGAGKEGKIYLINRDQMAKRNLHYNAGGSTDFVVQTVAGQIGGSFDTPAYFDGRIFYAGNGDQLKAFTLTSGALSTAPVSTGPRTFGFPGATPSVSADNTNNGIVWIIQNASPAVLAAYNPYDLTSELYNSAQAAGNRDQLANGVKFTVPTIANGNVYVGNRTSVSGFGLLDSYLNWKYVHFGSDATNSAVAGDFVDLDHDLAPSLLEYALASDPNAPDPNGTVAGEINADHLQVEFHRNILATNLTYVLQSASTLGVPWTDLMTYTSATGWMANAAGASAAESTPVIVGLDHFVTVTIIDPTPVSTTAGSYYRLVVSP